MPPLLDEEEVEEQSRALLRGHHPRSCHLGSDFGFDPTAPFSTASFSRSYDPADVESSQPLSVSTSLSGFEYRSVPTRSSSCWLLSEDLITDDAPLQPPASGRFSSRGVGNSTPRGQSTRRLRASLQSAKTGHAAASLAVVGVVVGLCVLTWGVGRSRSSSSSFAGPTDEATSAVRRARDLRGLVALTWRSFDGEADGVGCRSGSVSDADDLEGVLALKASSEDECKKKCEGMGVRECTGIQFVRGLSTGCLTWREPVMGSYKRSNSSCLVRVPVGAFKTKANNTCSAAVSGAMRELYGLELQACQSLCLTTFNVTCGGVEYEEQSRRCMAFSGIVSGGAPTSGVSCSRWFMGDVRDQLVADPMCNSPLCRWGKFTSVVTSAPSTSTSVANSTATTATPTLTPTTTTERRITMTSITSATLAVTSKATSASSASSETCLQPKAGDSCYSNVVSVMRDSMQSKSRVYHSDFECEDLSPTRSFEDFQACLHESPDLGCSQPCRCSTAMPGESCYDAVVWVMNVGLANHPEQYPGLSDQSSFEEIQALLHADKFGSASCHERPCVEPPRLLGGPLLFCFSIVEPEGYEPEIIEAQLEGGLGIFACDGQALLSTSQFWVGSKPGGRGVAEQLRRGLRTIGFRSADVGISKDQTAANTQLFVNAWESLQTRTAYSRYDWTIKVDPDAVLVPARLRRHLRQWTGRTGYVRNCNKFPDSDDFPMMYGSLEIFSNSALQAYFKGRAQCVRELPWKDWGEDFFMGRCLTLLKVEPLDDFKVVSDGVCEGVDCTDSNAAAFHPFKSKESWLRCWRATEP